MRPRPLVPATRRRRRRRGRPGQILLGLVVLLVAAAAAVVTTQPSVRREALALGRRASAALARLESLLPGAPRRAATPRLPVPTPVEATTAPIPGAGTSALTHTQLAEMLTAAWGLTPTVVGPAYTDVRSTTPGADAIEAAAAAGDFGAAAGSFRPAARVTRLYLARALVDALGLGPDATQLGASAPAVSDAASIPVQDWGPVRLVTALGILPSVGGRFQPGAAVPPDVAWSAVERARALSGGDLASVLGRLATSVTVRVTPAALEPGQTASLSASVHDGELALPLPVLWSASAGVVAGGAYTAPARGGTVTLTARVPGGHALARVRVAVEAPRGILAEGLPDAVLAEQSVTFPFAVADAAGRTVTADSGRRLTVRLIPPSGPAVIEKPADHDGGIAFTYRPTLLGNYTLKVSARGLKASTHTFTVVPGSLGSLSVLASQVTLTSTRRVALAAAVLPSGTAGTAPKAVPVVMSATLDPAQGPPVSVGLWQGVAATSFTSPLKTLATVGPFTGPATLVVNLTTPGGTFLPARISIPIAGLGTLRLSPAHSTLTAGGSLLVTARAPRDPVRTTLSLAITAPDGGPLAPMRQVLNHGQAQFLLSPSQVGTYQLHVSGPGLMGASATVAVRSATPSRLVALLSTPFPGPSQALSLRVWTVDAYANPVTGPTIDVRWRYLLGPHERWHEATVSSGARVALPQVPAGGGCSVRVRLSSSALGLSTSQTLPCARQAAPAGIVAGTGVFLSYWVARDASPSRIVDQAVRDHVHTLYVEVAIPGTGLWGEPGLDRLLGPAHQAGLAVVAWVPANLGDPARDAQTAQAALAYRTPLGQGVDGLAADFEGDLSETVVRPYLASVRRDAGPERVVAAVTEPPLAASVPYALMARFADVLMPMDYWQSTESPQSFTQAYRAVSTSVALVRSEAPGRAVEPVLQGYDPFAAGGTGVYSPGPLAESGAVAAARQEGSEGAAFFQWGTLTASEWRVVAQAGRTAF